MELRINKTNEYCGMDQFRMIAALLVIAIHTSPLLFFGQGADLFLSHAIARIAVPFFFMSSGFFLISRYQFDAKPLIRFEKKTLLIYLAAILIYIPVNVYSGYFTGGALLPKMIKDFVFDGTLYHLWYLPASMLGAFLAWMLVRKGNYKTALIVSGALYLVGLLGDSYFGLVKGIPVISDGYQYLFQIMDYTRNGIFFAPLFFVMGGLAADRPASRPGIKTYMGLGISLAALCLEAFLTHHFNLVRHDSMYLSLIPCVYFLFALLKSVCGERKRGLRTLALLMYLIHPIMILVVRQFSKRVLDSDILITNTLLHFLAVSFLSFLASEVLLFAFELVKNRVKSPAAVEERAWVELNQEHLEHNVKVLKNLMPAGCEMMAVVKTNAYGHGAYQVATCLDRIGVRAYATATLEEAISLRKYGVRGEILILGYTSPGRIREIRKYDLTQTIVDLEHAERLNRRHIRIKVHVKVDTGMHRLGIPWNRKEELEKVFYMPYLRVNGIFTHLSCADSKDPGDIGFTHCQIQRFDDAIAYLREAGIKVPKTHVQSSYGLLNYPNLKYDYARIGIALYGVLSTADRATVVKPDLKPVLTVKAGVTHLQEVKKGEAVGYGRAFICKRDSRIATVSVGYGDGLPRDLFQNTKGVLINGRFAPFAGRLSMDQLAVDVTDLKGVRVGTAVTVIDDNSFELSAPVIADASGTISNELLSRLGPRLALR